MKSFSLILVMWVLALATIYLLNRQHEPINDGVPVVQSAAVRPVWTLTPRCPVTSRNLRRYVERIA